VWQKAVDFPKKTKYEARTNAKTPNQAKLNLTLN
jgi:hypothetical protein